MSSNQVGNLQLPGDWTTGLDDRAKHIAPHPVAVISDRMAAMRKRDSSWAAKVVMGAVILLIVAGLWIWQMGRMIKASYGYGVEATFAELPVDDDGFEAWLKTQPG